MAHTMLKHMRTKGVKSVGFLAYSDTFGEGWIKDFQAEAGRIAPEVQVSTIEQFGRSDPSVAAQTLKCASVKPDAIVIVAAGSGAAMPHRALIDRGYKGAIYHTHAAASRDLIRLGGKDVDGGYVVSGTAVVPELLPADHPSKALGMKFVQAYEKAYGAGNRNQFSAHAYDMVIVLEKAVPVALKAAKPGTKDFRLALLDAIEGMGKTAVSMGVLQYTASDHWGYPLDTAVALKIVNGDWTLEPLSR